MSATAVIDVRIENHGLYTFEPLTPAAKAWIEDNVEAESWQWLGGRLCLDDRRLAMDLTQRMVDDGLIVE